MAHEPKARVSLMFLTHFSAVFDLFYGGGGGGGEFESLLDC